MNFFTFSSLSLICLRYWISSTHQLLTPFARSKNLLRTQFSTANGKYRDVIAFTQLTNSLVKMANHTQLTSGHVTQMKAVERQLRHRHMNSTLLNILFDMWQVYSVSRMPLETNNKTFTNHVANEWHTDDESVIYSVLSLFLSFSLSFMLRKVQNK